MLSKVIAFCEQNQIIAPNDKIVVGVSGGPDSLCLLHLLKTIQPSLNLELTVVHLNHQLRGEAANKDADFVGNVAREWQLPYTTQAKNVAALAASRQQSLEETARQVRYAYLWQVASQTGSTKIAVGHNADDQAETLLMHLLRGSGLDGLRGMQPALNITAMQLHPDDCRTLPTHPARYVIRPLLGITRTEIEAYCHSQQLVPRQDHTNQDTSLLRNRLRHELLPMLASYNPNIRRVLWRTANLLNAEAELLETQLAAVWATLVQYADAGSITLHLKPWQALPLAQKRATLRQAIEQLEPGRRNLGFEHIENAISVIETSKTGAKVTLPHGVMLSLGYGNFTISDSQPAPAPSWPALPPATELKVSVPGVTALPGNNWRLSAQLVPAAELNRTQLQACGPWEAWLDANAAGDILKLRTRLPGDSFCPLGLAGRHQTLKKFMINAKIPAAQRGTLPLLVSRGKIIWVCGYRPADHASVRPDTVTAIFLKFDTI